MGVIPAGSAGRSSVEGASASITDNDPYFKAMQAEMAEKGKKAGIGIGMFGGAGLVSFLALQTLTACLVALLATAMDVWIAALIITVLYAAVAAGLGLNGKKQVSEATPPVPEQTTETLKEDVQWAKTQMPSGSK